MSHNGDVFTDKRQNQNKATRRNPFPATHRQSVYYYIRSTEHMWINLTQNVFEKTTGIHIKCDPSSSPR